MPTLAWTWTTLREALQAWPVKSGSGYLANLDRIIGLGELRLVRDLNLELFDHVTTAVVEEGDRIIDKPENCIAVRTVRLGPETFYLLTEDEDVIGLEDGSGGIVTEEAVDAADTRTYQLEQRSYEWCHEYAPDPAQTGRPRYYNELNSGEIEIVPTADQRYGVQLRYIRHPTDLLSQANPDATSWLSRSVPDALFAACLMEAEHFLKADDRYGDYAKKYHEELLPTARVTLRQLIRSGDYSPYKPAAQPVG